MSDVANGYPVFLSIRRYRRKPGSAAFRFRAFWVSRRSGLDVYRSKAYDTEAEATGRATTWLRVNPAYVDTTAEKGMVSRTTDTSPMPGVTMTPTTTETLDDRQAEIGDIRKAIERLDAALEAAESCEGPDDFDANIDTALDEVRALITALKELRA